MAEIFQHQVHPWTVGDLRAALDTLQVDDALPLQIVVAGAPGDFDGYQLRVVIAAEQDVVRSTDDSAGSSEALLLLADYPSDSGKSR
nr:DUF6225 family protein [Streptomyces sp. NBC_01177]